MKLLLDNKALHGLHRTSSTRLETQSFENAMDLGSTNQVCEPRALSPGLSGFWLILHENFPVREAAAEPHI